MSFELVQVGLHSCKFKQLFTHVAEFETNENSLLEEKKNNCFLRTTMRLFLVLFCTNEMIQSLSEKILQNWHLHVSESANHPFYKVGNVFCLDYYKVDITETEPTKPPNKSRSYGLVQEVAIT